MTEAEIQTEIRLLKRKIHQAIEENQPKKARLCIIRLKFLLKFRNKV